VGTLTRLSDGLELALSFGSLRVGRQKRSELVVDDPAVSPHHADICYESGRYVVYDHSERGTWINGEPVVVAQPLADSDIVRFGETEFRFSLVDMDSPELATALRVDGGEGAAPLRATHPLRGGKRRRRRRIALLLATLFFLLLLVLVGLAIHFLFPGLAERLTRTATGG
jgi:pSer/pThr/pTyr-binding forkhead associated (FHA) protein